MVDEGILCDPSTFMKRPVGVEFAPLASKASTQVSPDGHLSLSSLNALANASRSAAAAFSPISAASPFMLSRRSSGVFLAQAARASFRNAPLRFGVIASPSLLSLPRRHWWPLLPAVAFWFRGNCGAAGLRIPLGRPMSVEGNEDASIRLSGLSCRQPECPGMMMARSTSSPATRLSSGWKPTTTARPTISSRRPE